MHQFGSSRISLETRAPNALERLVLLVFMKADFRALAEFSALNAESASSARFCLDLGYSQAHRD